MVVLRLFHWSCFRFSYDVEGKGDKLECWQQIKGRSEINHSNGIEDSSVYAKWSTLFYDLSLWVSLLFRCIYFFFLPLKARFRLHLPPACCVCISLQRASFYFVYVMLKCNILVKPEMKWKKNVAEDISSSQRTILPHGRSTDINFHFWQFLIIHWPTCLSFCIPVFFQSFSLPLSLARKSHFTGLHLVAKEFIYLM